MSTSRDEWITSLNLSKLNKGYCGEIPGCKKENDVIVNSSAFETNQPTMYHADSYLLTFARNDEYVYPLLEYLASQLAQQF